MIDGLVYFACFLAIMSFVMSTWMMIELIAIKKSTHQVQLMPAEEIGYNEDEGFKYREPDLDEDSTADH